MPAARYRTVTAFSTVLATAALMFFAQSTEYRGQQYARIAFVLTIAGIVGTIGFIALAIRMFTRAGGAAVLAACFSIAALPFIVDWLLRRNGTQLKIHGAAIYGFFFYGFASEICAVTLFLALVMRNARITMNRAGERN